MCSFPVDLYATYLKWHFYETSSDIRFGLYYL